MQNSNFFRLVNSLSERERKQLRGYAQAVWPVDKVAQHALLACILEGLEEEKDLEKQQVWRAVFGKKRYNDALWRKYLSELAGVAEDFLAWRNFGKRKMDREHSLLRELYQRGLFSDFKQTYRSARKALEASPVRDGEYYRYQHLFGLEQEQYNLKTMQRTGETFLPEASRHLDHYYLATKLKYCCAELNYGAVVNIAGELQRIDDFVARFNPADYAHIPAIAIYFNLFKLLRDPSDETHYTALRQLIETHQEAFNPAETREFYAYAMNYCIRRLNQGEIRYGHELFHLQKRALESGVLLENGALHPAVYKNIVNVGLRVGETKWVRNFIHRYTDKIPARFRENAFAYSLAKVHFEQKEYSQAVKLLHQMEYQDLFYGLDARTLLLRTYFLRGEAEALFNLADSFSNYLRRNKLISPYHRTNYLNFVKFVKRIFKAGTEKRKRKALRERLEQTKGVTDKKWLLEQV